MLKDYPLDEDHKYQIHKIKGFKSNLPIHERANYFISAFLVSQNKQQKYPTTDDVFEEVMKNLKNGIDPTKENITDVLTRVAIEYNKGWRFGTSDGDHLTLF